MFKKLMELGGFAFLVSFCAAREVAPWVADLGNGEYQNPVLHADYSDPDVVRVGDVYTMVSSSFSHVPGLPVLVSKDLVNWRLVGHALPKLVPDQHFRTPRHGGGVWAPAIRHHGGKYIIYYPDPDFGIYVVSAENAEGPWTEPKLVLPGKGVIDPCPFWDDDGSGWLIHGWARSRSGKCNILTLCRMNAEGTEVLDEGEVIVDGNQIEGWSTLEGPKLYKKDGWYYVFAPAGGVTNGWQAVFRSKSIKGPYEHRVVLAQGETKINGPHQGAWVDTPSGEDWFLHFQDREVYGRVVHLEPMKWKDGWPVMGSDVDGDGTGEPVLRHKKPSLPEQEIMCPVVGDDFDRAPNQAWQWQANPKPEWTSKGAREGWLRMNAVAMPKNLHRAGNVLTQKFPAPEFVVEVKMEFSPKNVGDCAGLAVVGDSVFWCGLRQSEDGLRLVCVDHRNALKDGDDAAGEEKWFVRVNSGAVFLRMVVRHVEPVKDMPHRALCSFSYSMDGKEFASIADGTELEATVGRWVGAGLGVFCGNANPLAGKPAGWADFDFVRVGEK